MSEGIYLDNDVVLKVCSYGAARELLDVTSVDGTPPAILALARFTLRSLAERSRVLANKERAKRSLLVVLAETRALEPTPEEIERAADLEREAAEANLSFDSGESQLISMLLARGGVAFLTGDKRAVRAIAHILPSLAHRVGCLEQVVSSVLKRAGVEPLRSAVCGERSADRAISICFQCAQENIDLEAILAGLRSYSESLRAEVDHLLLEGDDISASIVP